MAKEIVFTPNIVFNGGVNQQGSKTEIADNEWLDGLNVEALPDGFRRRKGYTDENALVFPTVDQSFEAGVDSRIMLNGTAERIAQGFKISATANVTAVEVRMKHAGTPTVVINCAIYKETTPADGLGPAVLVTGLDTTDFSSVAAASLETDYRWFRFQVTTAVSLTLNIQYFLVISQTDASGGNEAILEEDTTPSQYTSGSVWIAADTGAYTNVPAADINFRVLTDATKAWVTGIHDYSLSDASTEYHLVFAGQYLYKNVSGTLTAVTNKSVPQAHEFTASQNTLPSMITANDRTLLAHGTDSVSKKFYINSSTEYWENEGISPPTATPTFGVTATDALSVDGSYEVDYFYWNNDLGIASERWKNGVPGTSVPPDTTTDAIVLTNLPSAVVREGDRATHLRIEVKGPSDLFFRKVGEVAIGVTTFTINQTNFAARSTEAEYNDQVPPQHSIKQIAENRQYIAGNSTLPWRLYFSKVSDGVAYHESFPTGNWRDFGKGDGDYITALAFMPPRILIVGFKNSIWAMDARSPKTSDRQKIADGVGIASHKSFSVVGNTIYFVSDSEKNKGMFRWSGGQNEPEQLADIDNTFENMNHARLKYASSLYYQPDANRHQWWTTMTNGAGSAHDRILVYDEKLESWMVYDTAANVVGLVEESNVSEPFIGQQGYEAKADSGTTDDGTAIAWNMQTKHFDFGATGHVKKLRIIDYNALTIDSAAVTVNVVSDFGARTGTSASLDYPTFGAGFTLGTDTLGGTAVMGRALQDSAERRFLRAAGRFFSFKFGGSTEFTFRSVSFGLQDGGRR